MKLYYPRLSASSPGLISVQKVSNSTIDYSFWVATQISWRCLISNFCIYIRWISYVCLWHWFIILYSVSLFKLIFHDLFVNFYNTKSCRFFLLVYLYCEKYLNLLMYSFHIILIKNIVAWRFSKMNALKE